MLGTVWAFAYRHRETENKPVSRWPVAGPSRYWPLVRSPAYKVKNSITHLLTYLLIPSCRVLLVQLTGLQLVKKFPAFHGTRRFITELTSFRHLSLSWASPIQSTYPHPTSWRSILILSTHLNLDLTSGLFPSGFTSKTHIVQQIHIRWQQYTQDKYNNTHKTTSNNTHKTS